jgi:hypothetical protein
VLAFNPQEDFFAALMHKLPRQSKDPARKFLSCLSSWLFISGINSTLRCWKVSVLGRWRIVAGTTHWLVQLGLDPIQHLFKPVKYLVAARLN